MKQQPATVVERQNTKFLILNAVSSEDEDSFSSGDSDGEAAISQTPDDVIFSTNSAASKQATVASLVFTQRSAAECSKPAVRRTINFDN